MHFGGIFHKFLPKSWFISYNDRQFLEVRQPQKEAVASQTLLDNGLTTYDLEARRHSGLSFMQVMQTQKRERELMKRMEFVPHTLENNNGEAAYTTDESSEEE